MINVRYTTGDAAAYQVWLNRQSPAVYTTASRFRPWGKYQMQGRETLVRVVGYDPSGALLTVEDERGVTFSVIPDQIDLWGVEQLDDESIAA